MALGRIVGAGGEDGTAAVEGDTGGMSTEGTTFLHEAFR